jgi:hypothetical protein
MWDDFAFSTLQSGTYMLYTVVSFLFAITASLYGSNEKGLLADDASPVTLKSISSPSSASSQQSNAASLDSDVDDDDDDTGEVDEDIIITDDENTNDDEGV